jgi:hypothetical protein
VNRPSPLPPRAARERRGQAPADLPAGRATFRTESDPSDAGGDRRGTARGRRITELQGGEGATVAHAHHVENGAMAVCVPAAPLAPLADTPTVRTLAARIARMELERLATARCPACGPEAPLAVLMPPAVRTMADLRDPPPEFCPLCGRQRLFVIPAPRLGARP